MTTTNNSRIFKQKKRVCIYQTVRKEPKKNKNRKICLHLYPHKLNSKGYIYYLGFARNSKSSTCREPIISLFLKEHFRVVEMIARDQELKSSMPFSNISGASTIIIRAKSWRNHCHSIWWKRRSRKWCSSSHRNQWSKNRHWTDTDKCWSGQRFILLQELQIYEER